MKAKDLTVEYEQDLRNERIQVYEDLWKHLKALARYDRPQPLTAANLQELTTSMRDWYFDKGGMFLSDDSRPAYFKLKDVIEDILNRYKSQADKPLEDKDNQSVIDTASQLRTRLTNDVGTRKSFFTNMAHADPSNIQQVAASQLELINNYYSSILNQAVQSFRWAIVAAGIGLAFFLAAVGFLLVAQQTNLSAISVISGALVEVISGINFYLYGKALGQLELFHVRLERTQRFLLANSVCENLKGDLQQTARAELVRTISGVWNKIPDVDVPDKKPSENQAG